MQRAFARCFTQDDFEQFANSLKVAFRSGDLEVGKFIFDRILGKPRVQVDLTTGGHTVDFTLNIGDRQIDNDLDIDDADDQLPPPRALP